MLRSRRFVRKRTCRLWRKNYSKNGFPARTSCSGKWCATNRISLKAILERGRLRLLGLLGFSGEHIPFISADIRNTRGDKIGFLSLMSRSRKHPFLVLIELQHAQDHLTTRY